MALVLAVLLAGSSEARFVQKPLPASQLRLFDLTVADFDRDGRLDVITINHTFSESWLRNRPHWGWSNEVERLGLSPTPAFPGLEEIGPPTRDGPGLYVFISRKRFGERAKNRIRLQAHGVAVSGRLVLDPDRPHDDPEVAGGTIVESGAGSGRARFDFMLEPGGEAAVRANLLDLPVNVSTDLAPANGLYVGARAVPARGPAATFSFRDRHAYALADISGNGTEELLEVVGGFGGKIGNPKFQGRQRYRIYRRGFNPYRLGETMEGFTQSGAINPEDCRGRGGGALDIDGDGRIDYFVSCEGAPARAYLQQANGSFRREDIPESEGDVHRWMQAARDPRPELVVSEGATLRVLERTASGWTTLSSRPLRSAGTRDLAIADVDGNGRADLLAAARRGNTLLLNRGDGRFRAIDPARRGLPKASAAAAWVDTRNRGRFDLHAVPQGLYSAKAKGRPGRSWRRTDMLAVKRATTGFVTWADFDADGRRDVVWATGAGIFARRHQVRLRRNTLPKRGRRWLQIDTPGAEHGARIAVRTRRRRAIGWSGAAEGSRYSQMHNRTYFGLGRRPGGRARVRVSWPDGTTTIRKRVRLNRVIALRPPRG